MGFFGTSQGEDEVSTILIDYPKKTLVGPTTDMVYMDYPSCHTMGGAEELLIGLRGNLQPQVVVFMCA